MKWHLAPLFACSLLAACAGIQPSTPLATLPARDQVGNFALEARFALRVSPPDGKPENSGGRLSWAHKNGDDRILISNPLGVGLAEIDAGPTRSRLRTGDGQDFESSDPDALIEQVTGQRLPVRRLPEWLLGRGATTRIESDAWGRPVRLSEAGWQIDYAYPDSAPGALPERVTLSRDKEIELLLRIEEWSVAP